MKTLLAILVTALSLSLAPRALSSDLLVYNNNDSGAGSLRQAISDNNATAGGNTIVISNIVTGTITLTGGQLVISKILTLIGPGANVLAVSGNHAGRVFDINYTTVSISGLTITNGSVATASTFPDYVGGGILNDHSTLTLNNCTLSGNSASAGGGIYNYAQTYGSPGTLTLNNCTFSGNSAEGGFFGGGGIYNDGSQHGYATLTLNNCTLSGNSAGSAGGGGIYNNADTGTATLQLFACTLSGNSASAGGGIYNYAYGGGTATLEMGNTILKAGSLGANIANSSGTITSDGYNLSSDNGGDFFRSVGDQMNTEPMLAPLKDNGGPVWTMMPLPGSPAIDQGKGFGLTTDQRGRPRPYDNPTTPNGFLGDGSDIGAVEIPAPVALIVSNTADSGIGSLRQAILNANTDGGDIITFARNVTGTITLTSGQLLITDSLTLIGPGANVLAVSGNHVSRVFEISYTTVSISGLTINNGSVTNTSTPNDLAGGGGIFNDHSTLTLNNCTLSGNSAGVGGGIFNNAATYGYPGTLTLNNCTLSGNSAGIGGGIYNDGSFHGYATLTLNNCTLSGNSAGAGGGIYSDGANGTAMLWLLGCTLSGNSAVDAGGGGIYNFASGHEGGTATLQIGNTILNAGASGSNILNTLGMVSSDGYNLSSDNGAYYLAAAGDQINADPKLGPLQNNGGPTFTHALLSNSAAIDKGKSFGLATDQRGAARPLDFASIANASGGDGSDIGAFELGRPTLSIQRVNTKVVLSWQSCYGDFTLQSVTNVIASNSWANVAGTPVVVANQCLLTNGPISGNRFYRLKGN
jgi:hypothetical protein